MNKRKNLKNELFTLYAKNLSIYLPEYTDRFLCPICLNEFGRDELNLLACAHVFPEKLEGELLTLSCAACDNKIGSEFNWHAVEEKKARIWEKEPKYGRFIPENGPKFNILSMWDFKKSIIYIYPPPGNILPTIWERWIDDIRGNSKGGGPYKFSIELKIPSFVPTKRDISHIHSAYLMMFYQFGYEYILSPNANIIRKLFNGSDLSWKPSRLVRSLCKAPESKVGHLYFPLIGVVIEPKDLYSFAVFLPSLDAGDFANVVFLPGIDSNFLDFLKNIELIQPPNDKVTVGYPTQITTGTGTIRYNIDIADSRSRGCADALYQIFIKSTVSDITNMKVQISIAAKSDTNII